MYGAMRDGCMSFFVRVSLVECIFIKNFRRDILTKCFLTNSREIVSVADDDGWRRGVHEETFTSILFVFKIGLCVHIDNIWKPHIGIVISCILYLVVFSVLLQMPNSLRCCRDPSARSPLTLYKNMWMCLCRCVPGVLCSLNNFWLMWVHLWIFCVVRV